MSSAKDLLSALRVTIYSAYRTYAKLSVRQSCENSADPDQTPRMRRLIWVYTICRSSFNFPCFIDTSIGRLVQILGQIW